MPHTYLNRWQLNTSDASMGGSYGEIPGAIGLINLSPARAGPGLPSGYAIATFANPIIDASAVYLGDDPAGSMLLDRKRSMAQELGFQTNDLDSSPSLAEAFWRVMTQLADPMGITAVKPLMPRSPSRTRPDLNGTIGYFFRGFLERREQFTLGGPDYPLVIEVIRNDYRRLRQYCLANYLPGDPRRDHYKRVLGFLARKFNTQSYQRFIPGDLPDEGMLRPRTTLLESFDQTDSDTLGPDQTWVEVLQDLDTVSNEVAPGASGGSARARVDASLSGDDHFAEIDFTAQASVSSWVSTCVRYAAAADTCYECISRPGSGTDHFIREITTGTAVNLATVAGNQITIPQVVKLEISGSDLELFNAGVSRLTATDPTITGNLQTGISLRRDDVTERGNDFKAEDAAAAGIEVFRRRIEAMAR